MCSYQKIYKILFLNRFVLLILLIWVSGNLAIAQSPLTGFTEDYLLENPNQELPDTIPIRTVRFGGQERFSESILRAQLEGELPGWWKQQWASMDAWSIDETGLGLPNFEWIALPFWTGEVIDKNVELIRRFLNAQGYLDADVHTHLVPLHNGLFWDLWFHLELGPPTTVEQVEILIASEASEFEQREEQEWFEVSGILLSELAQEYLRNQGLGFVFIRELAKSKSLENKPYNEIRILQEQNRLISVLKEHGFVYAHPNLSIRSDSGYRSKKLEIRIHLGPRPQIRQIDILGNQTVDEATVRRELTLSIDQPYQESLKRSSTTELYANHLFERAQIRIPLQPETDSLRLEVEIKEEPLRSFQWRGGMGYFDRLDRNFSLWDSYQVLRTQWSWVHRNVNGTGHQFSTQLKLAYFERYLEADYLFPFAFNTKSSVRLHPFIQYRDERAYDIRSAGVGASLSYVYSNRLTGTVSYRFALNDESNVEAGQVIPDSLLTYNLSVFNVSARYHSKGIVGYNSWSVQPSIELSGLFGESDFSYQSIQIDVRKYTPVAQSNVLATRIRTGWIFEENQDSLPSDVRFYNGGSTLVRGWSRHDLGPKEWITRVDSSSGTPVNRYQFVPTGGKAMLTMNVEWRQPFSWWKGGYGVVFLDGGQVWKRTDELAFGDIQWALGGGVRYRSPFGPIRMDVAYKLNPNEDDLGIIEGIQPEQSWARWALYISIGEAF